MPAKLEMSAVSDGSWMHLQCKDRSCYLSDTILNYERIAPFADVELRGDQSLLIPVHSLVLASSSRLISSIISDIHWPPSAAQPLLILPDFDRQSLTQTASLLYNGVLCAGDSECASVLAVLDLLGVDLPLRKVATRADVAELTQRQHRAQSALLGCVTPTTAACKIDSPEVLLSTPGLLKQEPDDRQILSPEVNDNDDDDFRFESALLRQLDANVSLPHEFKFNGDIDRKPTLKTTAKQRRRAVKLRLKRGRKSMKSKANSFTEVSKDKVPKKRKSRKRNVDELSRKPKGPAGPHVCHYCSRVFQKFSRFEKHLRTHTGERPFTCEHCHQSFIDRCNLASHMSRRHNPADKRFQCEYCEKMFRTKSDLTKHTRFHTGEKPFACQVCDRRFADSSGLLKHNVTHSGDRRYCCMQCGKKFTQSGSLRGHIMRLHPSEEESSGKASVTSPPIVHQQSADLLAMT